MEVHVDRFLGKGHEGVVHGIMNNTEHSFLEETYWKSHSFEREKKDRIASTKTRETPEQVDKKQVVHCSFILLERRRDN